jgi:tetratricopeptide (TPR) repeat protein
VKLLEQDDQHALAHLTLAVLCGKIGRHEEAIEYALRACELEPEDPFSFTALSVTYQRAWQGTQNHEFIRRAEEAMARAQMLESRPR